MTNDKATGQMKQMGAVEQVATPREMDYPADTPRTNEVARESYENVGYMANLARQLERELVAANAERDEARSTLRQVNDQDHYTIVDLRARAEAAESLVSAAPPEGMVEVPVEKHLEDLAAAPNERPAEHKASVARSKPASALPFTCGRVATRQSNFGGYAAKIFAADTVTVATVRANDAEHAIRDARYFKHAANAYPRLVEVVRELLDVLGPRRPTRESLDAFGEAHDLLRELGEL